MKTILLFPLFLILALFCCSCSNQPPKLEPIIDTAASPFSNNFLELNSVSKADVTKDSTPSSITPEERYCSGLKQRIRGTTVRYREGYSEKVANPDEVAQISYDSRGCAGLLNR